MCSRELMPRFLFSSSLTSQNSSNEGAGRSFARKCFLSWFRIETSMSFLVSLESSVRFRMTSTTHKWCSRIWLRTLPSYSCLLSFSFERSCLHSCISTNSTTSKLSFWLLASLSFLRISFYRPFSSSTSLSLLYNNLLSSKLTDSRSSLRREMRWFIV